MSDPNNKSKKNRNECIMLVLGGLVVIGTFGMYFVIIVCDLSVMKENKDVLMYILGALTALSTQVVSYYFGSSTGSKEKQASIDEIAITSVKNGKISENEDVHNNKIKKKKK